MNLQQLEYVLALDTHRNFARAAEACHVTQPTLSMMVQKLEAELGLAIFHRGKPPLRPTADGEQVLVHARAILAEVGRLRAFAHQQTDQLTGELRVGVIPTVAPYLLPNLLPRIAESLPQLDLVVQELLTEQVLAQLQAGQLDIGIIATLVDDRQLVRHPLYHEPFVLYARSATWPQAPEPPTPADLDNLDLWLLEEGHCFRNQVISLCNRPPQEHQGGHIRYRSGAFETLVQLVDHLGGATVLPQGAVHSLGREQQAAIHQFAGVPPAREVAAVVASTYPRTKLLAQLLALMRAAVPTGLL